jgi:alkylated DNA nucleotide flippase Atl1
MDEEGWTGRILAVVARIPPGKVLGYGDVAKLAGDGPGGLPTARDVGQVMAGAGATSAWWRVLRADGTPAPHLAARQLDLLRREGTPIAASGDRVELPAAHWAAPGLGPEQPTLFG